MLRKIITTLRNGLKKHYDFSYDHPMDLVTIIILRSIEIIIILGIIYLIALAITGNANIILTK